MVLAAAFSATAAGAGSLTISAPDFSDPGRARVGEEELSLVEEGGVVCAVELPAAGLCTFVLIARGDQAANEWPQMKVTIDGAETLTTHVRSDKWATYTFQRELDAGVHEVAVAFLNDFVSEPEDRNLHIQSLTVISPEDAANPELVPADELKALAEKRRQQLFEAADARIARARKGRLVISVLGEEGRPIEGAQVSVRQTRHEFLFGVALSSAAFDGSLPESEAEEYLKKVRRYFNHAVTENAFKWPMMEPRQGEVSYEVVDLMLDWCERRSIPLRGHGVFWGCTDHVPAWVQALPDDKLRSALALRARVLGARYKGRVSEFDLMNEMLHCSYFEDRLGQGLRRQVFHEFLAANPRAALYVNDYSILEGGMLDTYARHIRGLLDDGVPVGGIGIQGHFTGEVDPARVWEALETLAVFGLPIKITEYDCDLADEQAQAASLEALYRIAFSHPAVEGILTWSLWEKNSWRPGAALLRADLATKPAAETYERLVFDEWWTEAGGVTDASGVFECDAFFGDFEIVADADGKEAARNVTLRKADGRAEVSLQLAPKKEEPAVLEGVEVIEPAHPDINGKPRRRGLLDRLFSRD